MLGKKENFEHHNPKITRKDTAPSHPADTMTAKTPATSTLLNYLAPAQHGLPHDLSHIQNQIVLAVYFSQK